MSTTASLLADIEMFCALNGMSIRQFGIAAFDDTAFVYRLRKGLDVRASKIDQARLFMRQYRPNDRSTWAMPQPWAKHAA